MRYLGIDYGTKKVGVALSDEAGLMGFPHGILENAPALLETLATLAKNEGVGALVMGESKDLDGSDNDIAEEARAFGARLALATGLSLYFEDERFTSQEAARQFTREEKSRKPRAHEHVDASAAALILTSFLSKPNHG